MRVLLRGVRITRLCLLAFCMALLGAALPSMPLVAPSTSFAQSSLPPPRDLTSAPVESFALAGAKVFWNTPRDCQLPETSESVARAAA
jgi:hypothetical protein